MYIVDPLAIHFVDCACPTKSRLTRRANQGHFDIIAKTTRPAPKPAAGFLIGEGQN